MSFFGINVAGSAIAAYQAAENVTADNIANVNTPGASRQIAHIEQQAPVVGSPFRLANPSNAAPGTLGNGVLLTSVARIHQDSYDALFRGAVGSQNYFDVEQHVLETLQSVLGEPAAGVNAAYTNFRSATQQLAGNPTDNAAQHHLLMSAQALATVLNTSAQAVTAQATQTIASAAQIVGQINDLSDRIAALNGQIRASTAVGDHPNTYLDERDQLIDQLSTLIPTQTALQTNGSSLVTVNGKALVNDAVAYHLAPPVVGTNATGQPQLIVGGFTVASGQLGAYLDLYNTKLASYEQSLDNVATTLVAESSRITQAGYDATGTPGGQLFVPAVAGTAVGAGNLTVGIAGAAQIPTVLASTRAGSLVQALNAANNTVDTSAVMAGNASLANAPPAAGLAGTLTVSVDGIVQTYSYNTGPGGNATTVDAFINSFNAGRYGVTASFDGSAQRLVFARDPANIDLLHRAAMQATGGVTTPDFTIADTGNPTTTQSGLGSPAVDLLDALGASQINNVAQNASNAFGSSDASGINALVGFFSTAYGVPAIQTTSPTAIAAAGLATVTVAGVRSFHIGDVLTLDAQPGAGAPQENVSVASVNYFTNQITFRSANAHAAGFSIASAQTQTLQSAYASSVAAMGVDVRTAGTGNESLTTLSANIDRSRQSVDGINLDEETQNLIKYENAYAASAHVMTVLAAMLRDAVNLGTGSTF